MKDFDRDAASRPVSIPAQVDAPNDSDSEATRDIPPASVEDRSAKDRGRQDVVGSITDSDPSRALSTRVEGSACFEPPRVLATTLHLKRPRTGVVLPARPKAPIVDGVATAGASAVRKARFAGEGWRRSRWRRRKGPESFVRAPGEERLRPVARPPLRQSATPSPFASRSEPTKESGDRRAPDRGSTQHDGQRHAPACPIISKRFGDTGPARTPTGSQTTHPVSAISFLGDARGLLREKEVAEIWVLRDPAQLEDPRRRPSLRPLVADARFVMSPSPFANGWLTRTRRSTSDKDGENG